jgi:uncharacterized protein
VGLSAKPFAVVYAVAQMRFQGFAADRRRSRVAKFARATMSALTLRRTERMMTSEQALQTLERGFVGRLATVSEDGYPYCVPLLYVWTENQIFLHGTIARGHLQTNVRRESRSCFEFDEPGEIFDYGRFECDSGIAYRSVVVFGQVRIVEDTATKKWFCERLMEKYGKPNSIRPRDFFPRLDAIALYALTVERMTGKQQMLPDLSEQWPAKDQTKTPNARPA